MSVNKRQDAAKVFNLISLIHIFPHFKKHCNLRIVSNDSSLVYRASPRLFYLKKKKKKYIYIYIYIYIY